jgi:hypothetical protein
LKKEDLLVSGLMNENDEDIVILSGMKMSGGNSYLGVVIPITPSRKKYVETCLLHIQKQATKGTEKSIRNLENRVDSAIKRGINSIDETGPEVNERPRRACVLKKQIVETTKEERVNAPTTRGMSPPPRKAREISEQTYSPTKKKLINFEKESFSKKRSRMTISEEEASQTESDSQNSTHSSSSLHNKNKKRS